MRAALAASVLLSLQLMACECQDERLNGLLDAAVSDVGFQAEQGQRLEEQFADSDQAHEWDLEVLSYGAEAHGDLSGGKDEYFVAKYNSSVVPGFTMQNVVKIPADDSRSFEERSKGLFELHTDMMLERVPDKEGFMKFWAEEFPDRPIANISEDHGADGMGTGTFHMTAPQGGVRNEDMAAAKQGPTVAYDEKSGWKVVDRGD